MEHSFICEDKCLTFEGTLCRLPSSKSAPKNYKNKKSKKKSKTTASGRPREYHIKGFGLALQIWAFEVFPKLVVLHFVVYEENGHIPRVFTTMEEQYFGSFS
ncbi:unnamed protein product [Prunus armeniaca]